MTQSRRRALVAFTSLTLFIALVYIISAIDNKMKYDHFTHLLFDCKTPEKTNKLRQMGRFTEDTGQMTARIIVSSDLSEQELREFYQTNVFNAMNADEGNAEFSINQVDEANLGVFGGYDMNQECGGVGQYKAVYAISLEK